MESPTRGEKEKRYPEIKLNLEIIEEKTKFSFERLIKRSPFFMPFSKFLLALSETESKFAPAAKLLVDNPQRLVEISPIRPPSLIKGLPMTEFEKECIENTSRDFHKLGMEIDSENLYQSSETEVEFKKIREKFLRDPISTGFMGAASMMQQEYALLKYGARIFELARVLMSKYAPSAPWFSKDAIYIYIPTASDRTYTGDNRMSKDGVHLLRTGGFWGNIGFKLGDLRQPTSEVEEYFSDSVLTAIHESGHALFDELFELDTLNQSRVPDDRKEANMRKVLTEGLAIEFEKMGSEILEQLVPESPPGFNYGPLLDFDRREQFIKYGQHIKSREYFDGHKLMRRLKLRNQLGVFNSSNEEQILAIVNFLRKVDIKTASEIYLSNKDYKSIIKNPLNKLPLVNEVIN